MKLMCGFGFVSFSISLTWTIVLERWMLERGDKMGGREQRAPSVVVGGKEAAALWERW